MEGKAGQRTVQIELAVGGGTRDGEVEASLLLLAEADGRWLLVEADAEALQLVLYQLLVADWLEAVQHYQDQIAGPGCTYDLPPSPRTPLLKADISTYKSPTQAPRRCRLAPI